MNSGDTAWVLVSSALVLLMTVGLACFYSGLVRSKNSLNTMMMSIVAMGAIGVQWVLIGYSLAFAPGSGWLGGLAWVALRGVGAEPNPAYAATIPQQAHAVYQAMFAVITPALISGAIVERMRFRAYLAFLILWSTLVYAPLAHWVWGAGGWLQKMGALDFAGGTVVHVSAGVSALVAAWFLGPRRDYRRVPISPHNVPLVLIGAGLLWFGWFGFAGVREHQHRRGRCGTDVGDPRFGPNGQDHGCRRCYRRSRGIGGDHAGSGLCDGAGLARHRRHLRADQLLRHAAPLPQSPR